MEVLPTLLRWRALTAAHKALALAAARLHARAALLLLDRAFVKWERWTLFFNLVTLKLKTRVHRRC